MIKYENKRFRCRKQLLVVLFISIKEAPSFYFIRQKIPLFPFQVVFILLIFNCVCACGRIYLIFSIAICRWNAKESNVWRNHRYKMINAIFPARSGYLQNISVWTDIYLQRCRFELVFSSVRFLITLRAHSTHSHT